MYEGNKSGLFYSTCYIIIQESDFSKSLKRRLKLSSGCKDFTGKLRAIILNSCHICYKTKPGQYQSLILIPIIAENKSILDSISCATEIPIKG